MFILLYVLFLQPALSQSFGSNIASNEEVKISNSSQKLTLVNIVKLIIDTGPIGEPLSPPLTSSSRRTLFLFIALRLNILMGF